MNLEFSMCGDPFPQEVLCGSTQGSEALGKGVGLQRKWFTIRKQGSTVYREEPACIVSAGGLIGRRHKASVSQAAAV